MPTASRRVIWTLYLVVFVDIFQLTFIFPLLPKIVETLTPETSSTFLGTPAEKIGLLAGVAAGAEGLAAPYLGRLADRIGRRRVFIVAQLGGVASAVLVGCSPSYTVLLVGRAVGGICGGTAGIAAAYVADVTTEEERPGYMTYYMAAMFLGLSAGPVVGGFLSVLGGWRMACFTAAGVSALNFLGTVLFLPDSAGQRSTSEGGSQADVVAESCAGRIRRRCCKRSLPCGAWLICLSNFLASVGWTAFEALGVIYIQDSFYAGAEDAQNSATKFYSQLLSGAGIVGLVVNLFLYTRVQKLTGLKGSIALGGVLKAVGFWGIAMPSLGKWAMFVFVLVVVFGDQLQDTSIQTLITCVVKPTRFGEAMGQMTLFGNIARTLGPFAFGPVYEKGGKTVPWLANVFASILAIALCAVVRPRVVGGEADCPDNAEEDADATAQLVRQLSTQTRQGMVFGGHRILTQTSIPTIPRARSAPAARGGAGIADEVASPPLLRSQTVH